MPPGQLRAAFDGRGQLPRSAPTWPVELLVEPTGPDAAFADWLDDAWWTSLFEYFGDVPVTLRIAPTPDALLHPVLLYQLEMVRRVVPHWRIVGTAYVTDAATDEAIAQLAQSPYDEVRFMDGPRPGSGGAGQPEFCLPVEKLLERIRSEQRRLGTGRPAVMRVRSSDPPAESPQPSAMSST